MGIFGEVDKSIIRQYQAIRLWVRRGPAAKFLAGDSGRSRPLPIQFFAQFGVRVASKINFSTFSSEKELRFEFPNISIHKIQPRGSPSFLRPRLSAPHKNGGEDKKNYTLQEKCPGEIFSIFNVTTARKFRHLFLPFVF